MEFVMGGTTTLYFVSGDCDTCDDEVDNTTKVGDGICDGGHYTTHV